MLTVPETDDERPATDRLLRPYFGMHRFDWAGQSGVEFHLGYGDWIRLLRAGGFEVLDLSWTQIAFRRRLARRGALAWLIVLAVTVMRREAPATRSHGERGDTGVKHPTAA